MPETLEGGHEDVEGMGKNVQQLPAQRGIGRLIRIETRRPK